MTPLRTNKDNQTLYLQRNTILAIATLLLLSNALLSIFVFTKKEKTIIIPAITEPISITGKEEFSESYIEQMTIFFLELLLDLTPENIQYKSQILLKHVEPNSYHSISKYYKEEGERYKKYRLATKFDLTNIRISNYGKTVEAEGVFTSSFGEGSKSQKKVTYSITYKKTAGKLLITEFKQKEQNGN